MRLPKKPLGELTFSEKYRVLCVHAENLLRQACPDDKEERRNALLFELGRELMAILIKPNPTPLSESEQAWLNKSYAATAENAPRYVEVSKALLTPRQQYDYYRALGVRYTELYEALPKNIKET